MTVSCPPLEAPAAFQGAFDTGDSARRALAESSGPVYVPPRAVARPRDLADLQTLVRWAGREGVSLVPRGAGTGMPGGNVGPGVGVDMARHFQHLSAVDPATRTIYAGAGVPLARIEAAARASGLFFPPLPSSAQWCTVGGAVANNTAGARSFGYGAVTTWTDSVSIVLADGTPTTLSVGEGSPQRGPFRELQGALSFARGAVMRTWPRVTKNASGYALNHYFESGDAVRLLVGSEGTLGVITGARLRLAPVPMTRAVVVLSVSDLEQVPQVARHARELGASACEFFGRRYVELLGPAAGEAVPDWTAATVVVELAGEDDRVADGCERLAALALTLGAHPTIANTPDAQAHLWGLRKRASPAIARACGGSLRSTQFIEDSVVPPDRVPEYVRGVEALLCEARFDGVIFGHAGDGNLHVNPLVPFTEPDWKIRVRQVLEGTVSLVAALGGTLSGEHGDGRLRAPFLGHIWAPDTMRAFRRVKSHLDPRGIMNPGVILPLPGQDPLDGLGEGWPGAVSGTDATRNAEPPP